MLCSLSLRLKPGVFVRRLTSTVLSFVIACSALVFAVLAAAPATAVPGSLLEQKKAEQEALTQEMEQTKLDLSVKVAEYVELGKQIELNKIEVSEVSTELAMMEVELAEKQHELNDRVVELYRGDREEFVRLIFTARDFRELWVRSNYLARITHRDVLLINEVRLARTENMWLQEGLYSKMERLAALQQQADDQRMDIERQLEEQQKRAEQLRVDIVNLMWTYSGSEPQGAFDPNNIISDAQFRAGSSMTTEQIQAFLDDQPGILDDYRAKDHLGRTRTTAEMIAEACGRWGINPKVILVKLQKEQSLLTRRNPRQHTLDWALGVGATDSGRISKYAGFGKQIWYAAEKLSGYGSAYNPGMTMRIDGSTVRPSNVATYSLYKYTPHFRGNMSFWMIYWRYFGDPLAV